MDGSSRPPLFFHGGGFDLLMPNSYFGTSSGFPAVLSCFGDESLTNFHHQEKKSIGFHGFDERKFVDVQKIEPIEGDRVDPLWNGYSCESDEHSRMLKVFDSCFSRLPELRCFENGGPHQDKRQRMKEREEEESDLMRNSLSAHLAKRLRSASPAIDDPHASDLMIFRNITPPLPNPFLISRKVPNRQSELARQRRKRISDRTRDLERLMPWNKKMDMATMLGEAYKYIESLAAQVAVLRSMTPNGDGENQYSGSFNAPDQITSFGGEFGRLEQMNRQQLLQVLLNSPFFQTSMYSRKLCLCSLEQFDSLMETTMKNHL